MTIKKPTYEELEKKVKKLENAETGRNRAERSLQRNEERLELAFDGADMGMWDWNVQTGHVIFSHGWAKNLGYALDEIEPHVDGWSKLVHPEDISSIMEQLNANLEGHTAFYETEHRLKAKSGEWKWVLARGKVVERSADGKPLRHAGTHMDITDRKNAEEELKSFHAQLQEMVAERTVELSNKNKELQQSEERLELALKGADLGTWDWNIETGENITNQRWAEMLGYSVDEIKNNYSGWEALIHPKDLDNTLAALKSHLDHGTKYEVEIRMATKSGAWIWIQAVGKVVDRDRDGNPLRMLGIHFDITDRKLTEEALRESEGRYRRLTENARDMIFRMGLPSGQYEYVSPASINVFGYTPDEFYNTPQLIRKAIHPDWLEYFAEQWKKLLAGEMPPFYEYQIIDKAGHERWLYQRNVLVCDDDGKPNAIEGIVTDITERKQAEEALRESEERYRSLYLNTPTMLHSIDQQGKLVSVSHQWLTTLGYEREEVIGRNSTDFLTDESRKYANEVVLPEFYKTGQISEICYQFVKKNGDVIDVSLSAIAEKDENGKVIRSMAILNDITEKKRAEEALRESEEMYRTLFETMAQGVVYQDADGKIISANPASQRILGLTLSQMQGRTSIAPSWKAVREDRSEFTGKTHPSMLALKTGREVRNTIMGIFHPQDNQYHWINIYAVPQFRPGEKKPYQVYTTFEDITERKRVEEALRESEEMLRGILNQSSIVIYVKDVEGRFLLINRKFEKLFHISNEKIVGKTDFDIFPKENAQAFKENDLEALRSDTPIEREEVIPQEDGLHTYISVKFQLKNTDGKPFAICGISTDITERNQLEVERTKAAKLESIGLLAGGIAHDFNNILSAILGNVSLANMIASEEKSEASESLAAAESACGRARDLTQQLLTFSKGGAPVKKIISLSGLIKETSGFALRGSNVICRHHISQDLWSCEVDEGQISQVIHNLLINADQAMPEGGTIDFRAENVTVGPTGQLPLDDGGYIKLTIKDQGLGIPEEHLSKIFDPYFSTKQKGSGLGLATTYSIIKRHAGHVTVESGPKVGTTFTIYLPASRKQAEVTKRKKKIVTDIRGKILVMDDERALRDVISRMLEQIGHKVECASDGERAVKKYKQAKKSGQPFDALILDLTIPGGMGGRETIAKLLEIDPEVRAIVSSGYSNDPVVSNYQDYGFSGEVSKPYQIEQLRAVLQTVMKKKNG